VNPLVSRNAKVPTYWPPAGARRQSLTTRSADTFTCVVWSTTTQRGDRSFAAACLLLVCNNAMCCHRLHRVGGCSRRSHIVRLTLRRLMTSCVWASYTLEMRLYWEFHGSRGSHGIPMGMGIARLVSWEWECEREWVDGNGWE